MKLHSAWFGPLALLAFLVLASFAMAQPVAPPAPVSDTTVSVGGLFGWLRPYLLDVVGAVVAGGLGWLAMLVNKWFGLRIEASHREALHSAIMTGVSGALNYAGKRADGLTIDVRNKIIKDAIEYTAKSVPDALNKLGVSRDALVEMASSKLAILTEAPSSIPVAKPPANA